MAENYPGLVRDGVVVFEGGTPPSLADGVRVWVTPMMTATSESPTLAERLKGIIGQARGLPVDLAEQHDHYLHGQPKR